MWGGVEDRGGRGQGHWMHKDILFWYLGPSRSMWVLHRTRLPAHRVLGLCGNF